MKFLIDKLRVFLPEIEKLVFSDSMELTDFKYLPCGYKPVGGMPPEVTDEWQDFGKYDRWGDETDAHAWFYKKVTLPESMKGKPVEFYFEVNSYNRDIDRDPQFTVYVNGKLMNGCDSNHRYTLLEGSDEYEIYVYAYTGMNSCRHSVVSNLFVVDELYKKLYYDLKVPYDVLCVLHENSKEYADVLMHINTALNMIDMRVPGSPECRVTSQQALDYLRNEFYGNFCHEQDATCICIGHTHIDVAWLWTLDQTREKVVRSFSTVVALMKQYPEYKFMSSQAQLYQYLKEEAPDVYEDIKQLVKDGRWEVEGAMWVEADCNLTSGESLVRQVLFGKRFFNKEFGVDSKVLWLPDVFGYSAALPQILRKSGVDKFVTSKISWNESNVLPYDTFMWRGIDSTEIFTHFLTAQRTDANNKIDGHTTYTAMLEASQVKGAWNRYQQKHINNEVILTFGHGDGGGGPTQWHLEHYDRLKHGFPSIPTAKIEFAGEFLERVKKRTENNPKMPHWVGELYLEFHRGTYTSNACNKRYNRKSEFLYQNIELFSEINRLLNKKAYPQEKINEGWECILLNQFHDIIPGSSIYQVYEESTRQYEAIGKMGNGLLDAAKADLAANIKTDGGIAVFNPLSFTNSGVVDVDGEKIYVTDIPAKGWKVIKGDESKGSVEASDKKLENAYFVVEFADDYTISRIYDKRVGREVLKAGERANVIEAYEDFPREYDAWEISVYYKEKRWEINDVSGVDLLDEGVRKGIKITRKFFDSVVEQKIWLYSDIDKIDFDTTADWHQEHILVKAAFPVDINADKATYEIQFGSVERPAHSNTSWDAAKFEVCAHKYADISECDYGVSILNDCKYGHDIHDSVIRLTLLKCATHPSPKADKGHHEFIYSLRPHAGSCEQAGTVQLAYDLNNPMTAVRLGKQDGALPESYSFVSISDANIVVDTVKKAEDSDETVVRMYESWNKRVNGAKLSFGFDVSSAVLCDLMENEIEPLEVENNTVTLNVKPFEIVTVKVK